MNMFLSFSLLTVAATAFKESKFQHIAQTPLLKDACPSTSLLNGECQTSDSTFTDSSHPLFAQNASQSLRESYNAAQKTVDFPWTFWPECYTDDEAAEPFCVFSAQHFASGRGVFILDTASNAYRMLQKPAFSDPLALDRVNYHGNPSYEVREFPTKGRGLVANKTLHKGDQIFASTPLVIHNPDAYEQLNEEERLKLAHRGVDTLPPATQPLFWALLGHFKGDPVDDRINTNAFEVYINGQMEHVVFPEIAMLNHDCRPNAAYFFDEETLSHYIHATQTIYPGEEITITYINNEQLRDERVKNLKTNWGFECDCSSCSAHSAFVSESDARLKQIEDIVSTLDDWSSSSDATPEMADTLIALYEQERLVANLGVPYKHAAETYSSFGDKWNAIRFARLSAEYEILDKGFHDKAVLEMKKMAEDPEMTWSWKKRVDHKRGAKGGCGHVH